MEKQEFKNTFKKFFPNVYFTESRTGTYNTYTGLYTECRAMVDGKTYATWKESPEFKGFGSVWFGGNILPEAFLLERELRKKYGDTPTIKIVDEQTTTTDVNALVSDLSDKFNKCIAKIVFASIVSLAIMCLTYTFN